MPSRKAVEVWAVALLYCLLWAAPGAARDGKPARGGPIKPPPFATLHVPRLARAPTLEDFAGMKPESDLARTMARVEGFTQRSPRNGQPASQRTQVYLGYTDKNLYVIWLCFDTEPGKVRAHMVRRENINDDDQVGVVLDTFQDRRHGYLFATNPLGIQQDAIFTEDQGTDMSFDTVWNSKGNLTDQGYMVWMEIPFKSLRFTPKPQQAWGVFFERDIPRNSESSFYPFLSKDVQGLLTQESSLDGLEKIAPSHNLQFIPYTSFRAFRSLDDRNPSAFRFHGSHAQPEVGLDAKAILKDSLVFDVTLNPDFAQVESDSPAITVNQRFEVFFPEKRPFFQENASYFKTPIDLVFTRRIADPKFGVRLSGKQGPWAIGALLADDHSPSDSVLPTDPLGGRSAYFGILRLNREIGKDASVGMIYTDRELRTAPDTVCTATRCVVGHNRVGGLDASFKFKKKWLFQAQAVQSETKFHDGSRQAGHAALAYLERSSDKLEYNALYLDNSPGFFTATGFFQRPDIRRFSEHVQYRFRRKGKLLQWHGPSFFHANNWDHTGLRLEWFYNANYSFHFANNTYLGVYVNAGHTRLRPSDFSALAANRDYRQYQRGIFFGTSWWKQVSFWMETNIGEDVNYVPAVGPPVSVNQHQLWSGLTIRPFRGLTIDNSYILVRTQSRRTGASVFNNHIVRSNWNYQFNKEFSLRLIGEYDTLLANPGLTSLQSTKQFNADVLFTYLVHPGTAIYVGYNSDLQNLDRSLALDPSGNLLRTRNRFLNDGRQVFVKISYLFRF